MATTRAPAKGKRKTRPEGSAEMAATTPAESKIPVDRNLGRRLAEMHADGECITLSIQYGKFKGAISWEF